MYMQADVRDNAMDNNYTADVTSRHVNQSYCCDNLVTCIKYS